MKKRESDLGLARRTIIRDPLYMLLDGLVDGVDLRRPNVGGGGAEHELHRHRHSHHGRMSLPMTAR
jgi:hypothetical protein